MRSAAALAWCRSMLLRTHSVGGEFDGVWTQHSSMNIEDKPRLYAEIRRMLRDQTSGNR